MALRCVGKSYYNNVTSCKRPAGVDVDPTSSGAVEAESSSYSSAMLIPCVTAILLLVH